MNISQKRHEEMYKAIKDPIMDIRVKNNMDEGISITQLDELLFKLELKIHDGLVRALNLHKQ